MNAASHRDPGPFSCRWTAKKKNCRDHSSSFPAIIPPTSSSPNDTQKSRMVSTFWLINIGRATRLKACVTPSYLRSSPRLAASTANSSGCCISLPTRRLSVTSRLWVMPSMSTLRLTAGGGAGFSGACGPASAWRVLRPLPCALRFSAKATRGPAPGAHVFEPLHLTPDL